MLVSNDVSLHQEKIGGQLHLCAHKKKTICIWRGKKEEKKEKKNLWWSCSHAEGCHSAYWLNHVSRELNITRRGGGWDGTSQITSSSSNCIIVACWLCGGKTATLHCLHSRARCLTVTSCERSGKWDDNYNLLSVGMRTRLNQVSVLRDPGAVFIYYIFFFIFDVCTGS